MRAEFLFYVVHLNIVFINLIEAWISSIQKYSNKFSFYPFPITNRKVILIKK